MLSERSAWGDSCKLLGRRGEPLPGTMMTSLAPVSISMTEDASVSVWVPSTAMAGPLLTPYPPKITLAKDLFMACSGCPLTMVAALSLFLRYCDVEMRSPNNSSFNSMQTWEKPRKLDLLCIFGLCISWDPAVQSWNQRSFLLLTNSFSGCWNSMTAEIWM